MKLPRFSASASAVLVPRVFIALGWLRGTVGLGLTLTRCGLLQAGGLSPAGSVHDPAVLLAALGRLAAPWEAARPPMLNQGRS